ncbi:calcium/proton exchanger [Paxillus ammoniavirescens]|nr:calcium/proton exchanger [Paxillus ammoniavirescens]
MEPPSHPPYLSNQIEAIPLSPRQSASSSAAADGAAQRKKISLAERAATLLQPEKKIGPPPSVWRSLRAIILVSYLNVLLVFIPVSWVLNFAIPNHNTAIFASTFLAIIPLVNLLAFATEELSLRVGSTLAGLLNATLGNTVEVTVSVIALTKCQLDVVQSSLVGSILSNLLLVLGMCFFAGGSRFFEQGFGAGAVLVQSSLLTISVIAILLPGAILVITQGMADYDQTLAGQKILNLSHGLAIILLFIYTSYLAFHLFSHKALYQDDSDEIHPSKKYIGENPFSGPLRRRLRRGKQPADSITQSALAQVDHVHFEETITSISHFEPDFDPEIMEQLELELVEEPQMSVAVSLGLLVVVTAFVAATAEFLVDSIDGMTESAGIPKQFVLVVLLPILGNAAEHAKHITALRKSVGDRMSRSVHGVVGSSLHTALFVIPLLITLAWMLGKQLTLVFDPLQSIVLLLSVLTVDYIIQDGRSNWLKGLILVCLYIMFCVTFWYYPGTATVLSCG